MNNQQQAHVIWSRLPDLHCGDRGTRKARRHYILSPDQIRDWNGFESEIRQRTAAVFGNPTALVPFPPSVEYYSVGNEGSVGGRVVQNIFHELGVVLALQTLPVQFADVQVSQPPQHEPRTYPDTTIQSFGAQVRVVGEYKTPWTTNFDIMEPPNHLKALGQLARYMDDYRTRYGFLTTYDQTVFLRRTGPWTFEKSPVIYHRATSTTNPVTVSTRECMFFFSRLAHTGGWRYPGPRIGRALVRENSNRYLAITYSQSIDDRRICSSSSQRTSKLTTLTTSFLGVVAYSPNSGSRASQPRGASIGPGEQNTDFELNARSRGAAGNA
ncbi:hypothetical protein V8E54_000597 [Elaphomyces granulatus]